MAMDINWSCKRMELFWDRPLDGKQLKRNLYAPPNTTSSVDYISL